MCLSKQVQGFVNLMQRRMTKKEQTKYISRGAILLYLVKYTRPDIANSVREHSKVMDKATNIIRIRC